VIDATPREIPGSAVGGGFPRRAAIFLLIAVFLTVIFILEGSIFTQPLVGNILSLICALPCLPLLGAVALAFLRCLAVAIFGSSRWRLRNSASGGGERTEASAVRRLFTRLSAPRLTDASFYRSRLAIFGDGVFAVAVVLMIWNIAATRSDSWRALWEQIPIYWSYLLSFLFLGIYWSNRHDSMRRSQLASAATLGMDLPLLLAVLLIPISNGWMAQSNFSPVSVAAYGADQLACALALFGLSAAVSASNGTRRFFASASSEARTKTALLFLIHLLGVALSFVSPAAARIAYIHAVLVWIVRD